MPVQKVSIEELNAKVGEQLEKAVADVREKGGTIDSSTVRKLAEEAAAEMDVDGDGDEAAKVKTPEQVMLETATVDSTWQFDPLTRAARRMASQRLLQLTQSVKLTPEDKAAFMAAVVTGDRLLLPIAVAGGQVTVKVRSRTRSETQAVYTQLAMEEARGYALGESWALRLNTFLMTAQVAEFGSTVYEPLARPLLCTRDAAGKQIPPAWLAQADAWAEADEVRCGLAFEAVMIFELKYQAFLDGSKNQDFS
jgi:hypothetical protein